ncbi:DEKNAAC104611 [Brettanomyces naardenensis]|uniref:DEKNAAC104611 n=1 Tax=Brettanomyces naardenensis TaxID=13370 RepID=A0A448YRJ0_BRENA|nr:DEKNAAC104611 [Brettanomyces naardenensis]
MSIRQQLLKLSSLLQELSSNLEEYKTLKSISQTTPNLSSDDELSLTLSKVSNLLKYLEVLFVDELHREDVDSKKERELDQYYRSLTDHVKHFEQLLNSSPELPLSAYRFQPTGIDDAYKEMKHRISVLRGEDGEIEEEEEGVLEHPLASPSLQSVHHSQQKKYVRFKDHLVDNVSDRPPMSSLNAYSDRNESSSNGDDSGRDLLYHDDDVSSTDSMNMSERQMFIANQQEILNQDQMVDNLSNSVSRQHEMSLQISDEVGDHIVLLEDLESGMDRTNAHLIRGQRNIKKFRDALRENGDWCTILVLIVVLLFLLVVLK